MKRWTCPRCSSGALAPSKPARDDVRIWCLTCSKSTGKLVRRTCPSADKLKARKCAERIADAVVDRERARERETAAWTVAGLDVRAVAKACWRALPKPGLSTGSPLPTFVVRRRPGTHTTGHAWSGHRVTITFGSKADHASVWEVVLHELAHHAVGIGHWHDEAFNRVLGHGSRKLWDIGLPIMRGYKPSRLLEKRLREKLGETPRAESDPHHPRPKKSKAYPFVPFVTERTIVVEPNGGDVSPNGGDVSPEAQA